MINTPRTFARCRPCKISIVLTAEQANAESYQNEQIAVWQGVVNHLPCFPTNTLAMTLSGVKSTLRPSVTCDAACWNASTPVCKCSCGGSAHGSHS